MANLVTKIIISATDQASNVFDAIQRNAGKLATAVAGYFGVKLFSASVESAREFESAMSRVGAASGATAEELAHLKAAAEEAGASTQYTSVEAAAALENLAKAGLSASDAVATLPAVLDLATAGSVDLATSSDFVGKAVAGMGLSFQDAGRVADVLAKGANASNTSVTGLAQALSYAAPLANSLGLSLEQTVAIIGKFADAGIDASRAGTALNSILAQFSTPASSFRRELASAGIITGDFDQALRQLAASGPAGQKAILAVGQEAGPALRALLNQGIGALDELKAKLDDSAGSASTFAKVMGDNLGGASKGLGSAWEALKIKLGEPILGPLKEQVDALAGQLREFVSDGTAVQFGESIAEAFKAGAEWAQGFLSTINFDAVSARMQSFAADARAFFDDFGQNATNAGNVAKLAYSTMAAGFQSVMAAIYKVGEGMSWLTSEILDGAATIASGLSKVTFGDLSQSFAAAAESIKFEAQAAHAVMAEFGRKSGEAFDEAADSAVDAQEAWAALQAPVKQAGDAASAATAKIEEAKEVIGLTAAELEALGNEATVAGGKVVELGKQATASAAEQSVAADAAGAKIAGLRAEYARLIEAGDTQGAAQVLIELQAELDKTAQKSGATADDVEAAFERMGIASKDQLKQAAEGFKRDFELIKASGAATAEGLQEAFKKYAEAAIKANGGVATEALKAQAAQNGMKIEADEAGKVVIKSLREQADAAGEVADDVKKVGDETQDAGEKTKQASFGIIEATGTMQDFGRTTNDTASVLGAYMSVIGQLKDSIGGYSQSALAAVQSAEAQASSFAELANGLRGVANSAQQLMAADINFDGLTGEIAAARAEADKLNASAREMERLAQFSGVGFDGLNNYIAGLTRVEAALAAAKAKQLEFDLSVEQFYGRVDDGSLSLEQQADMLRRLSAEAEYYGSQNLDGLRRALADVQRQMQSIEEASRSTLASLNDELDQLNGNYIAIEKRRAEAQRRDITAQRDDAAAAGNDVAVSNLNAALAKLSQVESMRVQEAKERVAAERERREAERNRNKPSDADSASAGIAPAANTNLLPVKPLRTVNVNLNIGGKTIPVSAAESDATRLIRELETLERVSA